MTDKLPHPTPINPEIRDRLADALESGDYRQVKNYLRRGDCFCVIGVLCDLYAKDHPEVKWGNPFPHVSSSVLAFIAPDSGEAFFSEVPKEPTKWLGIPFLLAQDLASLNDVGISFSELARVIRALPDTEPIEALIRQCGEEE